MLTQIADGVLVHKSEFCQSNAVVVQGDNGVLLIDPGVQAHEMACLANDLSGLDQTVVAGFSTHPHWDHMLWQAEFGTVARYATARCAATAQQQLSDPGTKARIAQYLIPQDISAQVPLDLLGLLTGLPDGAETIPWDGPEVRIIEHQAHAKGHAALLIGEHGVLVAGDMLSDIFMPMLDVNGAEDPVGDYRAGLELLVDVAAGAAVVVPGHGEVGDNGQLRERIELDRRYVEALRNGGKFDDPRIGPTAKFDWTPGIHERQVEQLAKK